MTARIEVERVSESEFRVRVIEGRSESSHSVTVWNPATLLHVTVSPAVTVVSHTTSDCEASQKYRFPTSMATVSACVGDDTASMAAMEITVTPASERNDRRKFHLLHK